MHIGRLHRWEGNQAAPKLICLHGFLGSGADFEIIADHFPNHPTLIAPDLPDYSHKTAGAYSWEACLNALDKLVIKESKEAACVLVAYSMGGCIALQYAVAEGSKLAGLVLIGATAGMASEEARRKRIQDDLKRAAILREQSLDAFLDGWYQQGVIQSQENIPEPYLSHMRGRRRSNQIDALAEALTSLGTGSMHPAWDYLNKINIPTLLVTGANDSKFQDIACKMKQGIPNAQQVSIDDAGHACCFEQAQAFAHLLKTFLTETIQA